MFWVTLVAFPWQRVKAFDTAAMEDDGGTKAANDGSLADRILHSLLGKRGVTSRSQHDKALHSSFTRAQYAYRQAAVKELEGPLEEDKVKGLCEQNEVSKHCLSPVCGRIASVCTQLVQESM